MRVAKHGHQPRYQPARDDLDLLDEAFFDPEQQLIRLLQEPAWSHRATALAVPSTVTLLLVDRLLKHGLQPTISATHRRSGRITKSSPAASGGDQVDLPVEGPLAPV